jgi:hypothetical protein
MASRFEAIAQKEQSLGLVEQVSSGEQEATSEKWKEFHEVRKHQRQRRISNPVGAPCSVLGPRDPVAEVGLKWFVKEIRELEEIGAKKATWLMVEDAWFDDQKAYWRRNTL